MKQKKRWISLLFVALMLFAGGSVATANGAITVLIPDAEEDIISGNIPFTDAKGRSYDEVKAIMNAQHPYLVKFGEVTTKWGESKSFPEYFAGAYFHNDTEFIVKTTSTDDAIVKEVQSLFGEASSVELAKYSYTELLEKQAQVEKEIKNSGLEVRTWIDMKANTIQIEIANDTRGKNVVSSDFLARFSSEPFSISYIDNFMVEKTASIGNNTGCYYTATSHTSSLGCWITHYGVNKILCAGHSPNGVTGTSSLVYTSSSKNTKIGYVSFAQYNPSVDTNGDFALITAESSNTPTTGKQAVSGFYTGNITPGETLVLRSGKSSSSSGYVLATNQTIYYDGDSGLRHQMVQADYTTTVGESGNAVVTGNNLLIGIQGGGTGPSYFTPWSVIIASL